MKRRKLNLIERQIDTLNAMLHLLTSRRNALIEAADPLRRELNDF
jgi:hypothetical protein